MSDQSQGTAGDAGWAPDPIDRNLERWWDGTAWTAQTRLAALTPGAIAAAPPPPPPPPGWPPPAAPEAATTGDGTAEPPTAGRSRRWWLIGGVGAALVVVIAVVAVVAFVGKGKEYPSAWDPRVADLVAFDQKTRGLDYLHPVEVVFVAEDEFSDSVKVDETQLDEQDLQDISASEAALRAFGLIDGSVDLMDSTNDIRGAGTLAYYSPEEEKIYVRGTEVTPAVKATLVHELVHVLQDQHFDLQKMLEEAPDAGAVRSVVEGDANRIHRAYLDQLSADERDAITAGEQEEVADAGIDTMPDALVAAFSAPYALGEPAVGVLAARGGNSDVNQAFLNPPTADVQILDPRRIGEAAPDPVDLPDLPEGANVLSEGDTNGALFWDVVLARRVGLHPALAFADAWAGDSSTTYELDGRTCVVTGVRATDADGATTMLSTLQTWLAAGTPTTDEQTFVRKGSGADTVVLGVCDPGPDSTSSGNDDSQAAIGLASVRLELERQALEAGLALPRARCVADRSIDVIDSADLAADADVQAVQEKLAASITQAAVSCVTQPD